MARYIVDVASVQTILGPGINFGFTGRWLTKGNVVNINIISNKFGMINAQEWVTMSSLKLSDNGSNKKTKYKVIADSFTFTSNDGKITKSIIKRDTIIFVTQIVNDYALIQNDDYSNSGWIPVNMIQKVEDNIKTVDPQPQPIVQTEPQERESSYNPTNNTNNRFEATSNTSTTTTANVEEEADTLNYQFYDSGYADYNGDNLTIRNSMSILGLPYQFLTNADRPLSEDPAALGRKYAERIIARAPILFLTPGEPRFLSNYNIDSSSSIVKRLLSGDQQYELNNLLKNDDGSGRYYTFDFKYPEYYKFVNPMCRIAARMLGIQDETLDGVRLDRVNWLDFSTTRLRKFTDISSAGSLAFYIDSETQISENLSNTTTPSALSSTVNPMSDTARELNFLLGYSTSMLNANKIAAIAQNSLEGLDDVVNSLLFKNSGLRNLYNNVATVASGGRLIFPEIWQDSGFAKSYSIKIKLTTPDCDALSWYFNICVPLFHLICLTAPKSTANNQERGASGYFSPFLVRGYYKGLFNCDMGIITDMSIEKGNQGAWTQQGLPTEIDVNFTLTDLYKNFSISEGLSGGLFSSKALKNTSLMDYIANTCGININKIEPERLADLWFTNTLNKIPDSFKNIWANIESSIQNSIMNIHRKL